ncbi:hypothetical protein N7468_007671 [Penicillium chermesinum]|uniref:Uncharacterized protein n=1 Tax=Penicillium chermesinum TaxID=63820 RepID=A0A9W9TKS6_9EURO|nr:uncharacterized protein N7468_007671 [Penicillium chermesinum]KAJ5226446.1 hypothetical protein N7468_007671 [Penicillium chermesinum]KAJ6160372.1 hypothetical protein N7470_003768 [Penicillium chermesinum]
MDLGSWTTPLAYVGLASTAYIAYKFISSAAIYLLPSTLIKTHNCSGKNWALVTGATDGIGFGFCEELCSRGFNVILHGRSRTKLEKRRGELQADFPSRKIGIVVLDVCELAAGMNGLAQDVQAILTAHGGDLTVLVNNVGGETSPYTCLDGLSFDSARQTIERNASATLQITRELLPLLVAGERGVILNVSSISAYGMPYISVYSSTKGFINTFTRALEAECKAEKRNVDVIGLTVAEVNTPGHPVPPGLFRPTPRVLASAGLNRVGCGRVMAFAYFPHWIQGLSLDVLPRSFMMKITAERMQALQKETERANKKQ